MPPPLTFYFQPYTTSTVTTAVLDELEHALPNPLAKRIQLNLMNGEAKTPEYLANVNPTGRVPAIVHDGVSIWESAAITIYLGETFGVDQGLYPHPGTARGEAMKWIVWANTTLADAARRVAILLPAGSPGGPPKGSKEDRPQTEQERAQEEKARKDVSSQLDVLDGALKGRDYLLGKEYSLADTHVVSFVRWVGMMGFGLDEQGNVKAWQAKIFERPALKTAQ